MQKTVSSAERDRPGHVQSQHRVLTVLQTVVEAGQDLEARPQTSRMGSKSAIVYATNQTGGFQRHTAPRLAIYTIANDFDHPLPSRSLSSLPNCSGGISGQRCRRGAA